MFLYTSLGVRVFIQGVGNVGYVGYRLSGRLDEVKMATQSNNLTKSGWGS